VDRNDLTVTDRAGSRRFVRVHLGGPDVCFVNADRDGEAVSKGCRSPAVIPVRHVDDARRELRERVPPVRSGIGWVDEYRSWPVAIA
jgi:hypothetical protein